MIYESLQSTAEHGAPKVSRLILVDHYSCYNIKETLLSESWRLSLDTRRWARSHSKDTETLDRKSVV